MTTNTKSLQALYGPHSICFGCGPQNPQGLRLQSYPEGEHCVCRYQASPHHQAFPGVLNGGFLGCLFDCHSNWTAAWAWHQKNGGAFPSTVTAEFQVKLKRPTPYPSQLVLKARATQMDGESIHVATELWATVTPTAASNEKKILTATGSGIFIVVKPGHPAYHRWD